MIRITQTIALDEREIETTFIRASGPGGQNVNKVATAVQLRFNILQSAAFPEDVRQRLIILAGQRLTLDGDIIITAQRFRSQLRNRTDAIERLVSLIHQAAIRAPARRPTRPTKGSQQRRLAEKSNRGSLKTLRGKPTRDE